MGAPNRGSRDRETMVSAAGLRDLLSYDCETGALHWKCDRSCRVRAGDEAGGINAGGYRSIEIQDVKFQAHRIAWAIAYGAWPEDEIDHINGVRSDNRLANLRPATRAQNCQNRLGVKGVYWHAHNRRWVAQVKKQYLGSFREFTDAQVAYQRAARELFGPYARLQPLEIGG